MTTEAVNAPARIHLSASSKELRISYVMNEERMMLDGHTLSAGDQISTGSDDRTWVSTATRGFPHTGHRKRDTRRRGPSDTSGSFTKSTDPNTSPSTRALQSEQSINIGAVLLNALAEHSIEDFALLTCGKQASRAER
jgi:hypothetical protein